MGEVIINIGGPKYIWPGKYISTKRKNDFNYGTMPVDRSVILVPIKIESDKTYRIAIIAHKEKGGSGSVLVDFWGIGKECKAAEAISIKSKYDNVYKVFIDVGVLRDQAIIYLRLRRQSGDSGNIFIKAIDITVKKLKTILYFVQKVEQKRTIQYIEDEDSSDIRQIFLGPRTKVIKNSKFECSEDYSDIKIEKKLTFDTLSDAQRIIDEVDPDVFVSGSLPNYYATLPKTCKKAYISHGMIGDHVLEIKEIRKYADRWRECSLYCGAGSNFQDFVKLMNPEGEYKVVLNAMPQFDILIETDSKIAFKNKLITENKIPQADRYLLFAGFAGGAGQDFLNHNEDYYRTAIYLNEIAKKNNWFVFIKPRIEPQADFNFIQTNDYLNKYLAEYKALFQSANVCMVRKAESIYKYFFADQIIINGCSTVEIEACCAGKPLVIVRTKTDNDYSPYGTVAFGAAKLVNTDGIGELETALLGDFEENILNQKQLLADRGLSIDGKMSERAREAIFELLK